MEQLASSADCSSCFWGNQGAAGLVAQECELLQCGTCEACQGGLGRGIDGEGKEVEEVLRMCFLKNG